MNINNITIEPNSIYHLKFRKQDQHAITSEPLAQNFTGSVGVVRYHRIDSVIAPNKIVLLNTGFNVNSRCYKHLPLSEAEEKVKEVKELFLDRKSSMSLTNLSDNAAAVQMFQDYSIAVTDGMTFDTTDVDQCMDLYFLAQLNLLSYASDQHQTEYIIAKVQDFQELKETSEATLMLKAQKLYATVKGKHIPLILNILFQRPINVRIEGEVDFIQYILQTSSSSKGVETMEQRIESLLKEKDLTKYLSIYELAVVAEAEGKIKYVKNSFRLGDTPLKTTLADSVKLLASDPKLLEKLGKN